MQELTEFSTEAEEFNVKKRYLMEKGTEVNLDYFLFTAFEEEQNTRHLGAQCSSTKRFPPIVEAEANGTLDQSLGSISFFDAANELCSWYGTTYPVMASTEIMDYGEHAEFIHPFVNMLIDLGVLYQRKEGKRIPRMDHLDEATAQFWQSMSQLLKAHFESRYHLIWPYLKWAHQIPKKKSYDLKSLPPVGRWYHILRKSSRPSPVSADKSSAPVPAGEQRDDSAALAEVTDATNSLSQDSSSDGVTLKPQNSFVRRKQHKLAVELGFQSESVGEGQARCVKITRKSSSTEQTSNSSTPSPADEEK